MLKLFGGAVDSYMLFRSGDIHLLKYLEKLARSLLI